MKAAANGLTLLKFCGVRYWLAGSMYSEVVLRSRTRLAGLAALAALVLVLVRERLRLRLRGIRSGDELAEPWSLELQKRVSCIKDERSFGPNG